MVLEAASKGHIWTGMELDLVDYSKNLLENVNIWQTPRSTTDDILPFCCDLFATIEGLPSISGPSYSSVLSQSLHWPSRFLPRCDSLFRLPFSSLPTYIKNLKWLALNPPAQLSLVNPHPTLWEHTHRTRKYHKLWFLRRIHLAVTWQYPSLGIDPSGWVPLP